MEEEKKEQKDNKTLNALIIIFGFGLLLGLVGACGWYLGRASANKEENVPEQTQAPVPEQTQTPEIVEESVTVNEEEMNEKLRHYYWILLNFDSDYGTVVQYSDGRGSRSYLASLKDGDNLLNTNDKKIKFALLISGLNVLKDDQVCSTLNATGCGTGNRAVKVDEFKEKYKKVFNEDIKELKNCEEKDVASGQNNCVLNDYLTYHEITGAFEPTDIKLFFNKMTKKGNVYTLVIDAKDLNTTGDSFSYIDNGKQIIVEYTKDNDNISIKSITYKKS